MSLDVYLVDENNQTISIDVLLKTDLNVTHNLTHLADKLGFYIPVWHPENLDDFKDRLIQAKEMLPYLYKAYYQTVTKGHLYPELLPKNGWGTVESLTNFLEDYIIVSEKYPEAYINVST